jgi:hypothetical protein
MSEGGREVRSLSGGGKEGEPERVGQGNGRSDPPVPIASTQRWCGML